MLTGEELVSGGQAFVKGFNVSENIKQVNWNVSNFIRICHWMLMNLSSRFSVWLVTVLSLMLFLKNKRSKKHSAFTQDSEEFLSSILHRKWTTLWSTCSWKPTKTNEARISVAETNGSWAQPWRLLVTLQWCSLTNLRQVSTQLLADNCGTTCSWHVLLVERLFWRHKGKQTEIAYYTFPNM